VAIRTILMAFFINGQPKRNVLEKSTRAEHVALFGFYTFTSICYPGLNSNKRLRFKYFLCNQLRIVLLVGISQFLR